MTAPLPEEHERLECRAKYEDKATRYPTDFQRNALKLAARAKIYPTDFNDRYNASIASDGEQFGTLFN